MNQFEKDQVKWEIDHFFKLVDIRLKSLGKMPANLPIHADVYEACKQGKVQLSFAQAIQISRAIELDYFGEGLVARKYWILVDGRMQTLCEVVVTPTLPMREIVTRYMKNEDVHDFQERYPGVYYYKGYQIHHAAL